MTETKEKDYQLSDLILDACDEFDDIMCDSERDEQDIIHEIADNAVPIYYWDIAQYAAHNTWLMTEKPETSPDSNAHDQILANIYEAIHEGLIEHYDKGE